MWQNILAVCAGFSCICVAVAHLINIVKAVKKPSEDVHQKLANDNERLEELEDQYKFVTSAIGVLMRCDLVMLSHMKTGNNTGQMTKMENEIQEFLTNNR